MILTVTPTGPSSLFGMEARLGAALWRGACLHWNMAKSHHTMKSVFVAGEAMRRVGGRLTGLSRIVVPRIMADPTHKAVEEAWRKRLNSARTRYSELREERARNSGGAADLNKTNGKFAYRRAIHKENAALCEYKRVLTLF